MPARAPASPLVGRSGMSAAGSTKLGVRFGLIFFGDSAAINAPPGRRDGIRSLTSAGRSALRSTIPTRPSGSCTFAHPQFLPVNVTTVPVDRYASGGVACCGPKLKNGESSLVMTKVRSSGAADPAGTKPRATGAVGGFGEDAPETAGDDGTTAEASRSHHLGATAGAASSADSPTEPAPGFGAPAAPAARREPAGGGPASATAEGTSSAAALRPPGQSRPSSRKGDFFSRGAGGPIKAAGLAGAVRAPLAVVTSFFSVFFCAAAFFVGVTRGSSATMGATASDRFPRKGNDGSFGKRDSFSGAGSTAAGAAGAAAPRFPGGLAEAEAGGAEAEAARAEADAGRGGMADAAAFRLAGRLAGADSRATASAGAAAGLFRFSQNASFFEPAATRSTQPGFESVAGAGSVVAAAAEAPPAHRTRKAATPGNGRNGGRVMAAEKWVGWGA